MRIIVLQRHDRCRQDIQVQAIMENVERAEKIVFTDSPDQVLDLIKDGEPAIVVTGQMINHQLSGTELAVGIKEINPRALVIMYSVFPESNEFIDVVIRKQAGHKTLANLLVQDFDGLSFDEIKEIFEEARY